MLEPIRRALPDDALTNDALVSTGALPPADTVTGLLRSAHSHFAHVTEGEVADYIPALAAADPQLFGAAITSVTGRSFDVGDAAHQFSIQSISKLFVFALVADRLGVDAAREQIGVDSTGLPFNSIIAVEQHPDRLTNPMVNPGAIATTSHVPGATPDDKWTLIEETLSAFAGRPLVLDDDVYQSESASNQRNQSLAHLLAGYGRLRTDPDVATDLYTKQCSLRVNAHDLSVMGATLADGGVNPVTGVRVVSALTCQHVLAVVATSGLYERSGEWLYQIGLPGKSGVSGGVLTIAPGKGGLGTFSPPLDAAGTSVRGLLLTKYLSYRLGLNIFMSRPAPADQTPTEIGPTL